jgi:chromosomal replication initiation ATPase DnaA
VSIDLKALTTPDVIQLRSDINTELGRRGLRVVTLDLILTFTSDVCEIHRDLITGKSQQARFVSARHLFCLVAREREFSFTDIGRHISREHSTVIHAVRTARFTVERDRVTRLFYEEIRQKLSAATLCQT